MMTETSNPNIAVLIVEDDPLLRLNALEIVADGGFEAYEAANADEGFGLLERYRDIRVLFTDVDMPGSMDGLALARVVRERWPPVGIVIASGHVRLPAEELPRGGMFIPKPYAPSTVVEVLKRAAGAFDGAKASA